jgi:DNA-binding GntR family transcriptional regulator
VANAVERAYESVLSDILSGGHPTGSRLREEELAVSIGMSRTPVREALRRLHAEGIVKVLPNRGAVVANLDDSDLDDIFELRALLEGYGARRAAASATDAHLSALGALCDEMEERHARRSRSRRFDEIACLNFEFHRTLHEAGDNARLGPLLAGVMSMPLVRHTLNRYTHAELTRSFAHHRELISAISARDGVWAEAVMQAHMSAARNSLRRQYLGVSVSDA